MGITLEIATRRGDADNKSSSTRDLLSDIWKTPSRPIAVPKVSQSLKGVFTADVGDLVKRALASKPEIKPFKCAITSRLAKDEHSPRKILGVSELDAYFWQVYTDLRAGSNNPVHISGQDAIMRWYINQARKHSEQAGSRLHFFAVYDPADQRVHMFDEDIHCDRFLNSINDYLKQKKTIAWEQKGPSRSAMKIIEETLWWLEQDLISSHNRKPIAMYAYYRERIRNLIDSIRYTLYWK